MAGPTYDGKPYKTPHSIWAAVMRTQSPKGRKVLKEYREELWAHEQLARAPKRTVLQEQMLRRTKGELLKLAQAKKAQVTST